jgi:phage shock protein PspC (stress-responsive transcriptional regulator)
MIMNETKRLYRIEEGKMIAGVCGGVAEYFSIDPSIVRIIWLAACLATVSIAFWAYVIAAFVLPKKSELY